MKLSWANTNGLATLLQVKALPGKLYYLTDFNNGPAQYIQLYDTAATPTSQKPVLVLQAAADSAFYFSFEKGGRSFANGIFAGNSSTQDSYTAGAADCIFDAGYV